MRSSLSKTAKSTSAPASAACLTLIAAPRPATPLPMMMTFFISVLRPVRAASSGRHV